MSPGHREVEDKYDVSEDAVPSRLDEIPGVAAVEAPVEHLLEATYFDTDDFALAAAGITLRRRTGGDDAGWHLKLPVKGARDEVREPLGRAAVTVPKKLRDTVRVFTRDRDLRPVATVRNHRTVHRLVDAEGRVLAELADDRVTAEVPADETGPTAAKAWREWEIELVDGEPDLLEAAAVVLRDSGGTPARLPSKLARALGDRMPERPTAPTLTPDDPAAAVIQARLADQVAAVRRHDPGVRTGLSGGLHQMRVAVRRLRDALATNRPVLEREKTEPVRDELRWLANELGPARDLQVQRRRVGTRIKGLGESGEQELVRGRVLARVDEELAERYQRAHSQAVAALDSDRYFALMDTLDRLVAAPPWTDAAHQPAGDVLRKRVKHDWKRLRSRVEAAKAASDDETRAARLHEARKAAKRARYAAEPLRPLYGGDAKRFVKAVKRVQGALGDHHDAFVAQTLVRDLSDRAAESGDNAFTLGVVHAEEGEELAACEEQFDAAWEKASRKKLLRWLQ